MHVNTCTHAHRIQMQTQVSYKGTAHTYYLYVSFFIYIFHVLKIKLLFFKVARGPAKSALDPT